MNIVITGASKGIGKAIAEIFAANGYTLFLCGRNEKDLEQTASELETTYNAKVHYKPADLSIKEDCLNFSKWCIAIAGEINILVNNAGQFIPGEICAEADGMLEQMLQTNLLSAYYVTRSIVGSMKETNRGHIFNICSIASLQAYANGGSYGISKFALLGFSKNLREELKNQNIKVTAILPGAAYTNSWSGSGVNPNRIMEAKDVAIMIYAASQLSPQACVEEIILRPQLGDL
jgi:short-subunit dehydrogenase